MTVQGWECPKCGKVLAPWVSECPGPHGTFGTTTAAAQKCSLCGGWYYGAHTCSVVTR